MCLIYLTTPFLSILYNSIKLKEVTPIRLSVLSTHAWAGSCTSARSVCDFNLFYYCTLIWSNHIVLDVVSIFTSYLRQTSKTRTSYCIGHDTLAVSLESLVEVFCPRKTENYKEMLVVQHLPKYVSWCGVSVCICIFHLAASLSLGVFIRCQLSKTMLWHWNVGRERDEEIISYIRNYIYTETKTWRHVIDRW
jgi:hypothetical protein